MHPASASDTGFGCRSGSPSEAIGAAELIFAGRLVAQRKDEIDRDLTVSTIAVALRWKGPPFQFVEITSSLRSPSPFDAAQSFLIFASSRSADRWSLSACYPRALPLNIASEYLEALGEPTWQFR
jgi:hypothetical protein